MNGLTYFNATTSFRVILKMQAIFKGSMYDDLLFPRSSCLDCHGVRSICIVLTIVRLTESERINDLYVRPSMYTW